MRQVFNALPYILPIEDRRIIDIYEKFGTLRIVKRGNVLKDGGETNKLFLLKKGLCMYLVNYAFEKPRMLGLIIPNRAMGDITCISEDIVNVTTVAMRDSEVLVIPPDIIKKHMMNDFSLSMSVTKKIIEKQESHIEGMIANFTLGHEARLTIFYKALLLSYNDFKNSEWETLPIKLSNEELGMVIDATRVTVNRIHLKWHDEGKYKKENGKIFINSSIFKQIYDWHNYI